MSELSAQECTAGISRKALEAFKRNGDGSAEAPPAKRRSIGDSTTETLIIDTPYRKLALLETSDGKIVLRDVSFIGHRADVALIHLEREQAHATAKVLDAIEDPPADQIRAHELKTRRVRA